jgi:anaerobic selenocysteine-containing dehydrogenase
MPDGISRRNFLKLTAVGTAAAVLAGCQQPRRWVTLEPYVTPPEQQLAGEATWYASTCRQCPAGCGIIVRLMNGRAVKIEGNQEHPLNRGKLCARGQSGSQVLYNPDRLSGPIRQAQRGSRQYQALTWEEGINTLFSQLQAAGSGLAVWGDSTMSGHLYDLFKRFTTAVNAPAPIIFDLYTSYHGYDALNTSSQDLFNQAALPYYDLAQADVVYSFGADFLSTWLSAVRYNSEYGQFRSQALGKRGYFVQFEPRLSMTAANADQWEPIKPGTEALVAQALIRLIADQALGSPDRVARAKTLAGEVDINSVAAASDLSAAELLRLARSFATADHPLAIPGSSLLGQANAPEALKTIQALNLIAGNVDQPGGMSLSTGSPQPAVLQLPHSSLSDVQALINKMRAGQVQVLFVHGANPMYDLPSSLGFNEALQKVPFVVTFSPLVDETAVWSDLVLPDRTYLESWGYTVTDPSFDLPVVSSQQPVVVPVFDARSTADILLTVARGIPAAAKALPWDDEVAFLKETIAQLPTAAYGGTGADEKWARFQQHGGWWPAAATAPASTVKPASSIGPLNAPEPVYQGDEQQYPYFLNVYMSELLSDGRGANQPWLQGSPQATSTIAWQTWVELNPTTAQTLGVSEGDIVKVTSPNGELEAPVYVYPAIRPDTVGIPLGQGHTDYGRYARDRGSNPMGLIGVTPNANGNGSAWDNVRVKLTPTGQSMAVAKFEGSGVTEGFVNRNPPGR